MRQVLLAPLRHAAVFAGGVAGHLDVAAEWNPRQPILRRPDLNSDQLGPEPEREAEHLNTHRLGGEEMPEFVDEDDDTQQEHAGNREAQQWSELIDHVTHPWEMLGRPRLGSG